MKKFHRYCRIFILFLSCIICIGMSSSCFASEQSGNCGENVNWELAEGTLTIFGSGEMTDYTDSQLPPWFDRAEEILEISISSGITSIGDFAFCYCTNAAAITIPDTVVEIGNYSFAECKSLVTVELGEGLEKIGEGAFQSCEALKQVDFPASLQVLGAKAFYRCYSILDITIPSNVNTIGDSVFAYCTGLVRATINSSITVLPSWTFYGCTELNNISLAPNITSIGEDAVKNCDNLTGLYIPGADIQQADRLEESAKETGNAKEDVFAATHEMPKESISMAEQEGAVIVKTVTGTSEYPVSITEKVDYSDGKGKRKTTLEATVNNSDEWTKLQEYTDIEIEKGYADSITVNIQLKEDKVSSEELKKFAGKNIVVTLITKSGIIWKIDMSQMTEKSFSGTYHLEAVIKQVDDKRNSIASEEIYQVKFSDHVDFNTTVGIKIGKVNELASFYVKDGKSYELINTTIIDGENYAWLSLAGINKHTRYYIGVNVEGITSGDAIVPETMYDVYGLDEENSYLMDADGAKYRITGRSSRWGITGKQFAIYVGVAIGATVLIVGSVMFAFHIVKKSREKYELMAEEEALREKEEEEALRLEIMKELLGESDDKVK